MNLSKKKYVQRNDDTIVEPKDTDSLLPYLLTLLPPPSNSTRFTPSEKILKI